jgi:cell division protein FtsI/penicillin-binding protein 2
VRDGLRNSVNLVFVRLMRDIVRYHRARLDYDADSLLKNPAEPNRQRMLNEIADSEARQILFRTYRHYRGLTPAAAVTRLLGSRASSARQQAVLFYAWGLGKTPADLDAWLESQSIQLAPEDVDKLARAYGDHLSLLDYGYILGRHPLEVWGVGELVRDPDVSWDAMLERSASARDLASQWLFHARAHGAQDVRLRIQVERDAFDRMTPSWQRLGFPFAHLVPSYATAIGSSSDRPAALAELMGIIVNDGVRMPMLRFTSLHWGEGTPYETVMVPKHDGGERVMEPEVAHALRGALADVVDNGTARRVAGAFKTASGKKIVAGGKTGSGDNRVKSFGRGGWLKSSRVVNRTATFTFYIGDRYFGVLTAFVPGKQAAGYEFTSALAVSILRMLAPDINARMAGEALPPVPAIQPPPARLVTASQSPRQGG